MEFYLEVDDIDGLYGAIRERIKNVQIRAPFDSEYGMRECI
jgi:hypothetical protein